MQESDKQLIINAFQPLELDQAEFEGVFDLWQEVEFKRNEFITRAGEIERGFYVVKEGIQVVYILDTKGDKQVIGFSFDGSFTGIYDSFVKETGSHYFLETLTPTKLLKISLADYNSLFVNYPAFDRWGRIAHLDLLIGRVQREVELITTSAKERFEIFMKRCPEPLLQIPQKYLASYLNMTPETFSRLRKQQFQNS